MTVTTSSNAISFLCRLIVLAALTAPAAAETPLFRSHRLTPTGEYTFGIEGPAVDAKGNLYVVNLGKSGAIGIVTPDAAASRLLLKLPEGSIGNAIRFDAKGRMFIADYKRHNIFVAEPGSTEIRTYFHSDAFNQPNDMTIAADGTIYASDPSFKHRNGQVWRITHSGDGSGVGEIMQSDRPMSTANGIALSPDGKTLYVGESNTREIWAYRVDGSRLTAPRLVTRFPDFDVDGLRVDMTGTLYAARLLKGTIAMIAPDGRMIREFPTTAKEPTNLAFGGPDGKTVYVTQRKGGYIETFRTDQPGYEFCLQARTCGAMH